MTAAEHLEENAAGSACCETTGEHLIPVDIALAKGLSLADPPTTVEHLPLMAARDRILATAALAPAPMPAFDNAAMDGYAVRTADLAGEPPHALALAGRVAAGDDGAGADRAPGGSALRILTGAPVPPSFDAVVMQERTRREADEVVLLDTPRPGLNIRRAGEDANAGTRLLEPGQLIGARQLAVLAAIGLAEVPVYQRLRVAMFSTGSELRQPGEPLAPGQIYNTNRFTLTGMLERPWIELLDFGAVPDRPEVLAATLAQAAAAADVVVTTGGVSVGDEDHMPRLVREAGGDIHAMKIAIKPGKPLTLGRLGDALYIGLPGNPVAVFVTMAVVGAPILCRRAGLDQVQPAPTAAVAAFGWRRHPGRREYLPARQVGVTEAGLPEIEAMPRTNSARIAQLVSAEGFAVIEPEAREISPGAKIAWLPMERLPLA
ncbi:MAG: molybdopterin molybdotransferase MoeA [Alphaproteobacteria bacterium]